MPDPYPEGTAGEGTAGDGTAGEGTAPQVRAAGVVLWRRAHASGNAAGSGGGGAGAGAGANAGLEIALVHRPRYDDWSFPKGKLQRGEHLLRAVLREVEEETGIVARLGRRLTSSHYVTQGKSKRVDYWAATPEPSAQGQAGPQAYDFVPNDEVDRMIWLPPDEAARALSYDRDRAV